MKWSILPLILLLAAPALADFVYVCDDYEAEYSDLDVYSCNDYEYDEADYVIFYTEDPDMAVDDDEVWYFVDDPDFYVYFTDDPDYADVWLYFVDLDE